MRMSGTRSNGGAGLGLDSGFLSFRSFFLFGLASAHGSVGGRCFVEGGCEEGIGEGSLKDFFSCLRFFVWLFFYGACVAIEWLYEVRVCYTDTVKPT